MKTLNSAEKLLYYPITIALTVWTLVLWTDGSVNFKAPELWIGSVVTILLWILPFALPRWTWLARLVLWFGVGIFLLAMYFVLFSGGAG